MRALLLTSTVVTLALAGCANQPMELASASPSSSTRPADASGGGETFKADDLAWSTQGGSGGIEGVLAYHDGPTRYTCQGGDVILSPESAWSRRRMVILYGSSMNAAVPVSVVRARTPGAPAGDYARFIRKATCDGANHFSFTGLPSGSWFVITVAKPVDGQGEAVAVTRRVETRGTSRATILN